MLELSNIDAGYGAFQALFGISMSVKAGEAVAVIGSNGAGKTTLLRVISGLLPAIGRHDEHGRRLAARDAAAQDHRDRHRACARRPPAVSAPLGREQSARSAPSSRRRARSSRSGSTSSTTLFPRLKERRAQLAGTLSGGEQQMCAIGRALMSGPKLVLLDEPSMGLAPVIVAQVFDLVRRLRCGRLHGADRRAERAARC